MSRMLKLVVPVVASASFLALANRALTLSVTVQREYVGLAVLFAGVAAAFAISACVAAWDRDFSR